MKVEPRYVRCKVSPGLFRTEFYVMIGDSSAYVDRTKVRALEHLPEQGTEVDGEVLVYIVHEDDARDQVLVELPGEPVVGGLRTRIPKALFATA